MEFPKLYGKVSRGDKIKEWSIEVKYDDKEDVAQIIRKYGQQGGKHTESIQYVTKGKNIGKKNMTTVKEQALNEAKSLYKKQKEGGYREEMNKMNEMNEMKLPMLAHDYKKRWRDIKEENAYVQPKLDGVRMIANKNCDMYSRTGKKIDILGHLTKELKKLNEKLGNVNVDGEIYTEELNFEEISGLFRQTKNVNEEKMKKMKYYIFDMFDDEEMELKFEERYERLKKSFENDEYEFLELVKTDKYMNNIDEKHMEYIREGYEGLMIRNGDGKYKCNYRSKDLQKYKEFQDEEYEIVGIKEATGNDKGTGVFICKDKKGNEFSVRSRGSREKRAYYLKNQEIYVGKMLTVRYQNLTDNGLPRFPVGIEVRDYE